MNYGSVKSAQWNGVNHEEVRVECTQTLQLPSFRFSGAPSGAAVEMRDRLMAAFSSCELRLPSKRIIIGFSPRVFAKKIETFDLPVAIAVLVAAKVIPAKRVEGITFLGHLGLDGSLVPVAGIAALAAEVSGSVIMPWSESMLLQKEHLLRGGGFRALKDVLQYLKSGVGAGEKCDAFAVNAEKSPKLVRIEDISGQKQAKHMAVIAAAGGHSCMLMGPHGWGKSLLANAMWGLLPKISFTECAELRRIYASCGLNPIDHRPFRAVDSSFTDRAILGSRGVGGEFLLSHRGILFLDEILEWPRARLEMLRVPMESGVAQPLVVAATNTCPCGRRGSASLLCDCKPHEVHRYQRRMSGAFWDRFDLVAEVSDHEKLGARTEFLGTTELLRAKILTARERMIARQGVINAELRGELALDALPWNVSARKLAASMFVKKHFTRRGYTALLRTALTVCDLRGGSEVGEGDVFEAAHFRVGRKVMN